LLSVIFQLTHLFLNCCIFVFLFSGSFNVYHEPAVLRASGYTQQQHDDEPEDQPTHAAAKDRQVKEAKGPHVQLHILRADVPRGAPQEAPQRERQLHGVLQEMRRALEGKNQPIISPVVLETLLTY